VNDPVERKTYVEYIIASRRKGILIKHQGKLNRLYPSEYYLPVVDNQQAISK
jgi:hypothetical protein